jgi:mannose-1-phosphate guanylyltransferase
VKAILLAAGLGTRLLPLTKSVPKCLVTLEDRPLLDYWFENLTRADIGPFLINTHHLADQVRSYLEKSTHNNRVTLSHEPELLGTGGTLLANRNFFNRNPVLLAHADNLCLCDFRAFRKAHEERPKSSSITMMTFRARQPESCGIVRINKQGLVTSFHEKSDKPAGNIANGAVYIIEPTVVDFLASLNKRCIDFSTEVIPKFIKKIYTWANTEIHYDIGTPGSLEQAKQSLARIASKRK